VEAPVYMIVELSRSVYEVAPTDAFHDTFMVPVPHPPVVAVSPVGFLGITPYGRGRGSETQEAEAISKGNKLKTTKETKKNIPSISLLREFVILDFIILCSYVYYTKMMKSCMFNLLGR